VILFLRTADRVAANGLDSIADNQGGTFQMGSQRMQTAFSALQVSLADALDDPSLKPGRRQAGQKLKELCKELAEECKVVSENYVNALDRDQAKQDSSKLEFRGQLQSSLTKFAAAVGQLDDGLGTTAQAWGVEAAKGKPTPDALPPAPAMPERTAIAPTKSSAPADLLQVGTIWIGDGRQKLTVLERQGEVIVARFERTGAGPFIHIVHGTVKDGKFSWLAANVEGVKGGVGADNTGTINGEEVDFVYGEHGNTFSLHLDRSTAHPAP
jgi:hypothetical protein